MSVGDMVPDLGQVTPARLAQLYPHHRMNTELKRGDVSGDALKTKASYTGHIINI